MLAPYLLTHTDFKWLDITCADEALWCSQIAVSVTTEVPMPSRLLQWARENDRTLTEIADLSGYSVAYLSLVARGKREPGPDVKVQIARALRTRVADLFPVERAS